MNQESKISINPTKINGVSKITHKVFHDKRGWFTESFNAFDFDLAIGLKVNFVQDNLSFSYKGVLRGLHYQTEHPQGKLIKVISGNIYDVVVDLRKSSPTYGQSEAFKLSAENQEGLWVPPGLANGFLVLSEIAQVLYKTTDYYHPQSEVCLAWNDPTIAIDWPLPSGVSPNMNAKDLAGLAWDSAPKFE